MMWLPLGDQSPSVGIFGEEGTGSSQRQHHPRLRHHPINIQLAVGRQYRAAMECHLRPSAGVRPCNLHYNPPDPLANCPLPLPEEGGDIRASCQLGTGAAWINC